MKIHRRILTHYLSCTSPVDKEGYLYKKVQLCVTSCLATRITRETTPVRTTFSYTRRAVLHDAKLEAVNVQKLKHVKPNDCIDFFLAALSL